MKFQVKMKQLPDKLICESCGIEFSCGANAGKCWCFDVELKPEILVDLRVNFKDCLCQECLREINENV
jgi:hypothetical protein